MTAKKAMNDSRTSVPAADIIRNFGYWQQQALSGPLAITHHGRARVMMISREMYEQLQRAQLKPQADTTDLGILIDSMAEGFVLVDKDQRVLRMNLVAEAFFDLRLSEVRGLSLSDPIFKAANQTLRDAFERVQLTREMETLHIDSMMRPGRRLRVRVFPYGEGVAILFVNTTEQDRLRRDAENMRALRVALGRQKQVSILRLDIRGALQSADEMLTELTGFTLSDLQQTRLLDCVVPADKGLVDTVYGPLLTSGKAGVATLRVIVKSGEERLLKMALVPIIRDAVLTGTMLMITDAD